MISSREELEQLKGKVSDAAYETIERHYNSATTIGCYLPVSQIVILFEEKLIDEKDGELGLSAKEET